MKFLITYLLSVGLLFASGSDQLKIQILEKIDGTLIKDIDRNEKDFKVVKTIILFAKESNMKTIAEFVSSKAIYDKLMALDVDYMQGFYIAKPSGELVDSDSIVLR